MEDTSASRSQEEIVDSARERRRSRGFDDGQLEFMVADEVDPSD